MSGTILVEACVDSIESALAAARGGAHRVELCANLIEGGTTPSAGTLAVCRSQLDVSIFVLVRPRGGDFLYTAAELAVMLEDIRRAKEAGVQGIVTGVLRADGDIDADRTRELIAAARPLQVTFHRAFESSGQLSFSAPIVVSGRARWQQKSDTRHERSLPLAERRITADLDSAVCTASERDSSLRSVESAVLGGVSMCP